MSYTEATIIVTGGIAALMLAGWAREGWRWMRRNQGNSPNRKDRQ